MNKTMINSLIQGLKHFAIVLGVLVLGGIIQALTNFHPIGQLQNLIWTTVGASIIGAINSVMHWLQSKDINKDTMIIVQPNQTTSGGSNVTKVIPDSGTSTGTSSSIGSTDSTSSLSK